MIPFNADEEYETDWLVSEFASVTRKDLNKKDIDPRQNAKKEFNHPKDSMMSIIYALVGLGQDTEGIGLVHSIGEIKWINFRI